MRYISKLLFLCILCTLALFVTALPALAQTAETIEFGDTVEGSLTADTASVEYTFEGELGQYITITMIADDFDAFLRLNDSKGNEVATNDDGAGNLNARIGPFKLPFNDSYTIVTTSLSGTASGSFSVSLAQAEINNIEYTQTVDGELSAAESAISYNFTGEAGDSVTISMNSDAFDSYLRLASGDNPGVDLVTDDDSGGDLNASIGPYTLPATGEYVITATSLNGTSTGKFTLSLNKIEVTALTLDEETSSEVTSGQPVYFSFEGKVGQAISVTVDSGDSIDTTLSLRGPDNYEIASDDDSGGRIDPEIRSSVLSQDGIYTVVVTPYSDAEVGEFTIKVSEVELPSLDEEPQQIRLSDKQTQQVLVFTGKASEKVRLTIALNDSDSTFSPSITVTQSGTSLTYISSSTISEISFVVAIPNDGTVNVQIDDYTYTSNVATVTLERLSDE
jgi:pre-peptidase